jgi:hypothetical protein
LVTSGWFYSWQGTSRPTVTRRPAFEDDFSESLACSGALALSYRRGNVDAMAGISCGLTEAPAVVHGMLGEEYYRRPN